METKQPKTCNTKPEKLSYNELESFCSQLQQQNAALYERLKQADYSMMLHRLEFLFKVIENRAAFSSDFVGDCTKEIEDGLTIKPAPNPEK